MGGSGYYACVTVRIQGYNRYGAMLIFFSGGGHMSGGHMSCVRVPGPSSVAAVVLGGAGHASLAFDAVIMASSLHRRLLARRLFAVVAELNDADALVSPINIPRLCSELCGILKTTQPSYLHNLITVQPPRSTRSSSLVTLARSSVHIHITNNRSFLPVCFPSSLESTPGFPPSTTH